MQLLGRKEEALSEGRRAMELAAHRLRSNVRVVSNEVCVTRSFAMICAWAGETDLALEQLEAVTKIPGGPSYGELRLDPMWDPLRGDPRFEKIVASLAPKESSSSPNNALAFILRVTQRPCAFSADHEAARLSLPLIGWLTQTRANQENNCQ